MESALKRAIKYSVACLLIAIMLLFIANNIVFLHSHKLANGKVLVHAHPYNKGQDSAPFKKHHHTDEQFFQLAHVQLLFIVAIVAVLAGLYLKSTPKVTVIASQIHSLFIVRKKGRAPPSLSCPFI